ncbi:MAG: outer membrane beta-barrel domain-containing protein [Bdellovibrionales bacterium]|nr:outer membrane beta-barrel domain-containing protein [Bdellovibrionales bacterium]
MTLNSKMCRFLASGVLAASTLSLPTFAADREKKEDAVDIYAIPKVVAVQNRTYPFIHNGLTFQLGYAPLDAFNKSFLAGLSYTYSLSEFTSWEVLNFVNAFNIETDLKSQLLGIANLQTFGANTAFLDYANWMVTTGFVYTPLYNKSLLFNRSIVHSEFSFVLDAGTIKFQFAGNRPTFGGGLIMRFFLSPTSSLKFDFRNHLYFNDDGMGNILGLVVGYHWQFGEASNEAK